LILRAQFARINVRKINTAFAVRAAAFFSRKAFKNQTANVKYGCRKNDGNGNSLKTHATKLRIVLFNTLQTLL